MSTYNRKFTEYALLPNGAYPLDARSHFGDFAEAYNSVVEEKVATAEAPYNELVNKRYYVGQIITTTKCGTWQITNKASMTLYFGLDGKIASGVDKYYVRWGENTISSNISFLYAIKFPNKFDIFQTDGVQVTSVSYTAVNENGLYRSTDFNSCLIPFSGSGGSSVSISGNAPITIDDNKISLSLDTNSGLFIDNGALAIKTGNGIKAVNNELTLSIGSGLSFDENKSLYVIGNHKTVEQNESLDSIPTNNYIYQKI